MVPRYAGIECLNRVNIYKHCWQQSHQHQHPDIQYVPRFARKNCPRKACKYRQIRCFFVVKIDWKTFSRGLNYVQDQMLKNTQSILWNGKHIPKNHEQSSDFILSHMDCTDRPNFNKNIIAIFGTFYMSASRNIQHQSCLLNTIIKKARQRQNLNLTRKYTLTPDINHIPPFSEESQKHFSTTNTILEVTDKAKQCSDLST